MGWSRGPFFLAGAKLTEHHFALVCSPHRCSKSTWLIRPELMMSSCAFWLMSIVTRYLQTCWHDNRILKSFLFLTINQQWQGEISSHTNKRVNPVSIQQRLMQKQELWTVSRLFESASYVSLGDPDGPGWEAIVKVCKCQYGVKTPMWGFPSGLGRRLRWLVSLEVGVPRRWCPSGNDGPRQPHPPQPVTKGLSTRVQW